MENDASIIINRKLNLFLLSSLVIGIFLVVLFARDIPARMTNGDYGRVAIATLDEVRRPFLEIHTAESLLMNDGYSEAVQKSLDKGIKRGQDLIGDFKKVTQYNPEVLRLVERLGKSFESWVENERAMFAHKARSMTTGHQRGAEGKEEHRLLAATSAGFSRTMEYLGDGEGPIHDDIHHGSEAVTELTVLSGVLIALLLAGIFYLQWSRSKVLKNLVNEVEQQVKERTTELETINKELESFSYSVSHDLRAPLRAIDGFSQVILEDYTDKLDDAGKDYLQRLRTSTQHMGALIDDLLRLSRVTRTELKIAQADLSELAQDVILEMKKSEPERAVEVVVTPGLQARADSRLMRVVLENLLGNAWKFAGKRTSARIEFGQQLQDGESVFFVRDNGAGFDMRYVDKLFGAFQRLHTDDEFPGTGVGLATVQRIILRHSGRVWAEGEVDKGATFYFTLV